MDKRAEAKKRKFKINQFKDVIGGLEGFPYIIPLEVIPNLSFGSKVPRECLPTKGPSLSTFMRAKQGEILSFPGPFEYSTDYKIKPKVFPSKHGHAAFAAKARRFPKKIEQRSPGVGYYETEVKKIIKPSFAPFNTSVTRKQIFAGDISLPGPGVHNYHIKRPELQVSKAFGSHNKYWPAVAIVCTPTNNAKCHICERQPCGDYWYDFKKKKDMCRFCMKFKKQVIKMCSTDRYIRYKLKRELTKYRRVRHCSFFHIHDGTTGAYQIIPVSQMLKKIRQENYLYPHLDWPK